MKELVNEVSEYVALAIEITAVIVVAVGTAYAVVAVVRHVLGATKQDPQAVWLEYARWLVAGLTFQLAADIVHTTIAPSWADIGRTGAIAVIRTFLTFFLDRDMDQILDRRRAERA